MPLYVLKVLVIGLATGVLAGIFGVGGALLSTPAIRLVLRAPPLIAVGTTLPVVIPAAISGGIVYWRRGLIYKKVVIWAAPAGMVGAAAGAGVTRFISGTYLLTITALIILYVGIRFLYESKREKERRPEGRPLQERRGGPLGPHSAPRSEGPEGLPSSGSRLSPIVSLAVGFGAGFIGGLLGIGGGIILIPAFVWLGKMPPKMTFGTSLVIIAAMAVPGSIVHFALKHIDVNIMAWLTLGVIPGGWLGARFAQRAKESLLVTAFGLFLVAVAIYFGLAELLTL